MDAELASDMRDTSGCPMKNRRKHKTDSVLVQAAFNRLGFAGSVDSQRFDHIGTSAEGCRGTRSMFRHRQASTCNYKGCCCRNVKSLCRARPSPRRIDENLVTRSHRKRAIPHCFGHACELINRLAFHGQAGKRCSYLRVCNGRLEKALKEVCGLRAAEVLTMHEAQCRLTQFQIGNLAHRRRSVWRQLSFGLF